MEGSLTVVSQVTAVFSAIADWIVQVIPKFITIFYSAETGLTFLGQLSLCGLGIGVFFLIMGMIQNFLHFRG